MQSTCMRFEVRLVSHFGKNFLQIMAFDAFGSSETEGYVSNSNHEFLVRILCVLSHNWVSGLTSVIHLTFPSSGTWPHLLNAFLIYF